MGHSPKKVSKGSSISNPVVVASEVSPGSDFGSGSIISSISPKVKVRRSLFKGDDEIASIPDGFAPTTPETKASLERAMVTPKELQIERRPELDTPPGLGLGDIANLKLEKSDPEIDPMATPPGLFAHDGDKAKATPSNTEVKTPASKKQSRQANLDDMATPAVLNFDAAMATPAGLLSSKTAIKKGPNSQQLVAPDESTQVRVKENVSGGRKFEIKHVPSPDVTEEAMTAAIMGAELPSQYVTSYPVEGQVSQNLQSESSEEKISENSSDASDASTILDTKKADLPSRESDNLVEVKIQQPPTNIPAIKNANQLKLEQFLKLKKSELEKDIFHFSTTFLIFYNFRESTLKLEAINYFLVKIEERILTEKDLVNVLEEMIHGVPAVNKVVSAEENHAMKERSKYLLGHRSVGLFGKHIGKSETQEVLEQIYHQVSPKNSSS